MTKLVHRCIISKIIIVAEIVIVFVEKYQNSLNVENVTRPKLCSHQAMISSRHSGTQGPVAARFPKGPP